MAATAQASAGCRSHLGRRESGEGHHGDERGAARLSYGGIQKRDGSNDGCQDQHTVPLFREAGVVTLTDIGRVAAKSIV
jgi:hypothetical protein